MTKIVFSNGATLSTEVPIEKFKENHISKPFNPLIANMFYKAGFVESWGKGTNNIIDDCLKVGMPAPSDEYTFQAVKVTFFKTPCTHASHLATSRIGTWPADASTLGHPAHRLFGQLGERDARLSLS